MSVELFSSVAMLFLCTMLPLWSVDQLSHNGKMTVEYFMHSIFFQVPLQCQMVVNTKQDDQLLLLLASLSKPSSQGWSVYKHDEVSCREGVKREGLSEDGRGQGTGRMQGSRQNNSPWNAETTAWLPGQFYSPVVSHLSRRPSSSEPPSLFCVFIYFVSASEDVRGRARKGVACPKCLRVSGVWSRQGAMRRKASPAFESPSSGKHVPYLHSLGMIIDEFCVQKCTARSVAAHLLHTLFKWSCPSWLTLALCAK